MKANIWSFVTSLRLLLDVWWLLFTNPDYQKRLMCPLINRLGRAFVSKQAASLWKAQPSFWVFKRKLKARPSVWKARPHVCVITRPTPSQSPKVVLLTISHSEEKCFFVLSSTHETSKKPAALQWFHVKSFLWHKCIHPHLWKSVWTHVLT